MNTGFVNGAMLGSFVQACLNNKVSLDNDLNQIITVDDTATQAQKWYPLDIYQKLCNAVLKTYTDPTPIFEKVGEEMMGLWFNFGPGKSLVHSASEFLKFQTGSKGYYSMVKGTAKEIGDFKLVYIDEKDGIALVQSTTPLNRNIEAGVLRGGVKLFSSTYFARVTKSDDDKYFMVEYH